MTDLNLPYLYTITNAPLKVRVLRPRPRSADRARSRAHRAEPSLPLSLRVATRASDWGEPEAEDPASPRTPRKGE